MSQIVSDLRVRVDHPHNPDLECSRRFRYEGWSSPWYFPGETVTRDSLGRRNGTSREWLVLRCASRGCEGVLLVNAESLADAAEDALEAQDPP